MINSQSRTLSLILIVVCLAACQQANAPASKTVPPKGLAPVNDIKMYYEIHGDGPPLILLHGGLGNAGYWSNQIPALSRTYRVIAVDSRGHGRSTLSEQQISYSLMASDVVSLLDYLGIRKASILGWSDGGIIGLDLAIKHPDRVTRLIAYGANYNPSGLRANVGEDQKFKNYLEQAARDYRSLSPDPTKWEAFQKNIGQMWTTEPNFTPEQLRGIRVPTLILDGETDEAILTEHTREMAGLIPTADLILIPGTGHFAPSEKAHQFNRIVLNFLAK